MTMDIETSYSDNVIRTEMMKMIRESARAKADSGFVLSGAHQRRARRIHRSIRCLFWGDGNERRSLAIKWSDRETGYLSGNAAFVEDRATAIALHAACRADDNCAPEPPADL
jgi:hypothetical protein